MLQTRYCAPTRQCRGLSSTAVREYTRDRGVLGLQGPLASGLRNRHCILV